MMKAYSVSLCHQSQYQLVLWLVCPGVIFDHSGLFWPGKSEV